MNKYSSKAVKTAATVGMSLAMVLSAVPAVGNVTNVQAAITGVISARTTATEAHKILTAVLDEVTDYAEMYGEKELVTENTKATIDDKGLYFVEIKTTDALEDLGDLKVTINKIVPAEQEGEEDTVTTGDPKNGIENGTDLFTIAKYLVANSYAMDDADIDEDVIAFAKFIKGYDDATKDLGAYFADGTFKDADNNIIAKVAANGIEGNIKTAEAAYKVLKDNDKYLNAVIDDSEVRKDVDNFKVEVEDYKGENEDVYNKDYVKALEDTTLVGDITVYDAVLETIVSEMKEVKALLKSTNDDVKAYKKDLATKVEKLAAEAAIYLAAVKADEVTDKIESNLEKALNAFREADATALKNFVEDFIGEFYTLTPKQLNSGKYVVRLENADYGRYVDTEDVFGLVDKKATDGLEYLLTTVIDNEESEETYYDVVINTVTTVEELLKAVTDDIDGLTLNSTLTSAQANKIIKAKKALNQLVDSKTGEIAEEYTKALTSKEKKEVLANVELIDTLYLKLILNGTVTQSGWVDKGNGDWDYIAEDGSRPSKWIASGANWYYVKNGTMLRNSWIASDAQGTRWYYVDDNGVMVSNTTVNGYTFNSYGVWVK